MSAIYIDKSRLYSDIRDAYHACLEDKDNIGNDTMSHQDFPEPIRVLNLRGQFVWTHGYLTKGQFNYFYCSPIPDDLR